MSDSQYVSLRQLKANEHISASGQSVPRGHRSFKRSPSPSLQRWLEDEAEEPFRKSVEPEKIEVSQGTDVTAAGGSSSGST